MVRALAWLVFLSLLLLGGCNAASPPTPSSSALICPEPVAGCGFDILSHELVLEVDPRSGYVKGSQTITLDLEAGYDGPISFSNNAMRITGLGASAAYKRLETDRDMLQVQFGPGASKVALDIQYEGQPTRQYVANAGAVYNAYFACDWMFCAQEDFADKASMRLELVLPEELETIGPGALLESGKIEADGWHAVWQTDADYSAYLYSFAIGDFTQAGGRIDGQAGDVELRYFGHGTSGEDLEKMFAPTADMIAFFAEKAGTPFPRRSYTQLVVPERVAQEAVSHSIIGAGLIAPILETPQEDWVIAHELAHQWWGNGVTCEALAHFWLNEGITTFMVAAWKEHRWGRAAYDREMELARGRLARATEAGFDVPLSFAGDYPSLGVRRAVQYSKGALFMDALRGELGDELFWAGLAAFTSENMQGVVTSSDFQRAFEKTSGRDLADIFGVWVYE